MRLYLSILFDQDMRTFPFLPSPGGFEVCTKDGKTYGFDFNESQGGADTDNPNIVNWRLKDEDYTSFPHIEELRNHLHEVVKLTECYVDTEAFSLKNYPVPLKVIGFCIEDTKPKGTNLPEDTKFVKINKIGNDPIFEYVFSDEFCSTFSYDK